METDPMMNNLTPATTNKSPCLTFKASFLLIKEIHEAKGIGYTRCYSLAIVSWELIHNKLPAYVAAFKVFVPPSAILNPKVSLIHHTDTEISDRNTYYH
ncbi:hypothetical protein L1987_62217 [Smallanthus sonchifolius]|uniref:Uncharacterized protein n=1 Tax=Smallanthus sonchifolius TaxID=185202 RepID=A0ACB9C9V4_9ASTR|nr:hypothetical protein L1987_62217 [Smallanthus sonchifolius]